MILNKVKWDVIEKLTKEHGLLSKTTFYGFPEITDPEHTIVATDDVFVQPKWNIPDKIVVSTAITGSFFSKRGNPNQPITAEEIYNSAKEVCEEGAPVIHIHVRNKDGYNRIDVDLFQQTLGRLKKEYPDRMFECCIVPRYEGDWEKLKQMMELRMTETITVNTVATYIGDMLQTKGPHLMIEKAKIVQEYGCKPRIAVYSDGDIDNADRYLIKTGIIEGPTHWGILPALPGCSPMNNPIQMVEGLLHLYGRIKDIDPDAVVQVCAAGRASIYLATLAALLGLNVRIGMEDTVWKWPHKDDKITNNAECFRQFKTLCQILGREIATPNDYRTAIGLKPR